MSTLPTSLPHLFTGRSQKRIAIQGVRGAFHEIAARQFFGDAVEIVPATTFADLVQKAADPERTEAAVMAIENSIAGSILGNYNLLQHSALHIIGEVFLPIRQNLLALPGVTFAELREVHSHPMALAQCAEFLSQHPQLRLVESDDTAASAALIARENHPNRAAIASTLAAELYGLTVLAPAIETHPVNFTRFLVLQPATAPPKAEGLSQRKVSVSFTAAHRPGSLSRVLATLAAQSADLTKIQSVPLPGRVWEYLFFVDFTLQNPAVIPETLRLLDVMTTDCKVLGIYKPGVFLMMNDE